VRRVGRGAGTTVSDLDQLCGHCGEGKLAISPEGEVWPCVFSRWLRLGNVRESSLADIYSASTAVRSRLRRRPVVGPIAPTPGGSKCPPDYGPLCPPYFRKPCPPDGDQR